MKKTILIISVIFSIMFITACSNNEVITVEKVNTKVQEYFSDDQNDRSNLSYNYIDKESNIIVIGLIDNSKEMQQKLLNNIFSSKEIKYIKKEKLITFVKSEKNINFSKENININDIINTIVNSGPNTSSNPYDYIKASQDEYNKLLNYPEETFKYAIKDLIDTNANDGLKSYIEAIICSEINTNFKYEFSSAKDFLEKYKEFLTKSYSDFNSYDKYTLSLLK